MTKPLVIKDINEIQKQKTYIIDQLYQNVEVISKLIRDNEPLAIFEKLKFEKIGCEPLTGEPENVIEVINQCHTYFVSLMAAEELFIKHPGHIFIINWGNIPGYDIESDDGTIIAECFAATSYKSNGKLVADLKRLSENESAIFKYEFFYDKEFGEKQRAYYQEKFQGIEIIKFQKLV